MKGGVQGKEVKGKKSREVGGEAKGSVSVQCKALVGAGIFLVRVLEKQRGGKASADPYKGGK